MKKYALLILIVFGLVGCTQTPSTKTVTWQAHQQQLTDLTHWDFSGKLALITPEERHSLNIHWLQEDNNFHIRLSTFLGSTVLEVKKDQLGTQIIDDNGEVFWGEDAQSLITKLSGLTIPIDVLQQWVKGNPNNASYLLDEKNQVISLAGKDPDNELWSVNYNQYKNTDGINLPYKLELQRQDLRLKFSISEWHPQLNSKTSIND